MKGVARCSPLGDAAVTVYFGDHHEWPHARRIAALAVRLRGHPPFDGLIDVVPATTTLSVYYDPLHLDYATVESAIGSLVGEPVDASEAPGREFLIPVRYDGPDLAAVADATGLPVDEVVARHHGRVYRVDIIGFVPGFAYLGPLDECLVVPRRDSPRARVPAGSVAIAGAQTAIYPLVTPGGWHLIGSTDQVVFDPGRADPALFAVGDRVRFQPLT